MEKLKLVLAFIICINMFCCTNKGKDYPKDFCPKAIEYNGKELTCQGVTLGSLIDTLSGFDTLAGGDVLSKNIMIYNRETRTEIPFKMNLYFVDNRVRDIELETAENLNFKDLVNQYCSKHGDFYFFSIYYEPEVQKIYYLKKAPLSKEEILTNKENERDWNNGHYCIEEFHETLNGIWSKYEKYKSEYDTNVHFVWMWNTCMIEISDGFNKAGKIIKINYLPVKNINESLFITFKKEIIKSKGYVERNKKEVENEYLQKSNDKSLNDY